MASTMSAADRKYLNEQYMPRTAVPNADEYLENATRRSEKARKKLDGKLDIAYGDTPGQTLDVFPAPSKGAPVHVFIHGGYWRALDKSFYSEMAVPLVSAGATTVLLNYDLCPAVSVTEIVNQIRRAMAWVHKNAAKYNGDKTNITLSGHSAGGHLVGMMLATDWKSEAGLPNTLIKASTTISGLYDLRQHREVDVQNDIHLTVKETKSLSPLLLSPMIKAPCLVAVGGGETDLFHWQSLTYTAHLRANGIRAEFMSVGDDNHFDITERLAKKSDPLTKAIIAQMGL
jgi:arylformamidase